MNHLPAIAQELTQKLGPMSPHPDRSVHGGTISASYRWETERGPVFVKVAEPNHAVMFEAEADGLDGLRQSRALHVPAVLAVGVVEEASYLVLEWIDLRAITSSAHTLMGERLAELHQIRSEAFGWRRDNTIGRITQLNEWNIDWVSFFREQRLRYQFELAEANGYCGRLQASGAKLMEAVPAFFTDHRPEPSLLHGDLWGGNWGVDGAGQPVIFDPAVYYGDREADLAMTRLFGGFEPRFYDAYQASWPLDAGAKVRATLYNLYHVLNHLNLFGGGYGQQAEGMIDQLLAEIKA